MTGDPAGTLRSKQGYKDSNLEMTESESGALPFGDTPVSLLISRSRCRLRYYSTVRNKLQALFSIFLIIHTFLLQNNMLLYVYYPLC